jgi:hypothetical protein
MHAMATLQVTFFSYLQKLHAIYLRTSCSNFHQTSSKTSKSDYVMLRNPDRASPQANLILECALPPDGTAFEPHVESKQDKGEGRRHKCDLF